MVAALRERLARLGLAIDLDAAARRHRAAGGAEDPDSLLAFLLAERLIDADTYAALSSGATVIVGATRLRPGDAPTVLMAGGDAGLGGADDRRRAERGGPPEAASSSDAPAAGGGTPEGGHYRYVVVGEAGKGGMGTVHVARDVDLLRKVALKELAPDAAGEPSARSRFLREVQVTAQLDHPHIVPVYGLEVAAEGRPAYAMKLVEGQTFAELIAETRACYKRGQVPDEAHALPRRLEHFLKVCDAVDYAHVRGVIHRDLKPANLMLGRHNEVYVMDWGICRLVGSREEAGERPAGVVASPTADGATQLGTVVGTLGYMSPEQAQGKTTDLDARSDQCSLGLILFELVTLRAPFAGETMVELLRNAAAARRPPLQHAYVRGPVAPELVAIIERATALDPARRYPSVRALADDIRRFLVGEAVLARPDTAWQKLLRRLARHRQAVAMGVLGVAAVGLGTILLLVWRQERALEALRFREGRIQALVNDVARQGDRLQTELLEVQGELDALAVAAAVALERGTEGRGPVPWIGEGGGPADAGEFLVAPDVERAAVAPAARRLLAVAAQEAELLARAERALGEGGAARERNGSGALEMRVGLETGLLYRRPALRSGGERVDPRQQAWYRTGAGQAGPAWGAPFLDDGDNRPRVPLVAPILGAKGDRLGVVSLVLSLDRVLDNLLAATPVEAVRQTYLLDSEGRILDAHGALRSAGTPALLGRFPDPALLERAGAGDNGHVASTVFGTRDVVAFDRIHPFEWTLLVVVPESALFAAPPDGSPVR